MFSKPLNFLCLVLSTFILTSCLSLFETYDSKQLLFVYTDLDFDKNEAADQYPNWIETREHIIHLSEFFSKNRPALAFFSNVDIRKDYNTENELSFLTSGPLSGYQSSYDLDDHPKWVNIGKGSAIALERNGQIQSTYRIQDSASMKLHILRGTRTGDILNGVQIHSTQIQGQEWIRFTRQFETELIAKTPCLKRTILTLDSNSMQLEEYLQGFEFKKIAIDLDNSADLMNNTAFYTHELARIEQSEWKTMNHHFYLTIRAKLPRC